MERADLQHLRTAIAVAHRARAHGNRPFGAVLVAADGRVLAEAENTQLTSGDCTGHAEMNLIRQICPTHPPGVLASATLYASGEPCAMCAGAIFWSGIGRVVFGVESSTIHAMAGEVADRLGLSCRAVLASGRRAVAVEGPLLEAEARQVFEGFFR